MATLKMKKMPKAPKTSASIAVKEAYCKRVAEVNKENRRREALNKKSHALDVKIAKLRNSK